VPADAVVDAAQAESALGHFAAAEFDEEWADVVDKDLRAEEEALFGRYVNPKGIDYSCLADADASGWHPPLVPRRLFRSDFHVTLQGIQQRLRDSYQEQLRAYERSTMSPEAKAALDTQVACLDPTQHQVYDILKTWAEQRLAWRQRKDWNSPPPSLRLLLLGTAGTGKTHTAKIAISQVRHILGRFSSVATVAHTGVAAANLGGGAVTIHSLFKLSGQSSEEDLTGEKLDIFVAQLRDAELVLIDEISTVGAGQFEMISRRLEQVGKALWRERVGTEPPSDLGGFGGFGIILIGDFGQLPPVLASSLLPHSKLLEPQRSGLRGRALQGRLRFQEFVNVVRLRRIHRQKGADLFKESTIRLRDAAVTLEDYKLWQEHVLASPDANHDWDGGEDLLSRALTLVAENEVAGRVNGSVLRSRTPALCELVPDSFDKVVVRCESAHNEARAARRPADQYRQLRPATHLFPGARVMLSMNRIWDEPTVHLGLMNGARGVVVAIVYASADECRVDGISLAGVGYPEG
jgi:hypothetical protein